MGDLFDRRDRRCIRAAAAEFETVTAVELRQQRSKVAYRQAAAKLKLPKCKDLWPLLERRPARFESDRESLGILPPDAVIIHRTRHYDRQGQLAAVRVQIWKKIARTHKPPQQPALRLRAVARVIPNRLIQRQLRRREQAGVIEDACEECANTGEHAALPDRRWLSSLL